MTEKVTRIEVEIFGEYYTLKGVSSPEEMMALALYVNRKMIQLATRNTKLSKSQTAVLAALNIADELMKLQEEHDNLVKMLEPESKDK
ncbi:MAG: cell division protein ZapA [Desulfotomaculaceae bacterium]|nr:cell division protein ZapA [Desulfotomaculaceae bacterium]MDD4766501.1 cell division protein ZapA [Desulfotomaculaceae bacterium]